MREVNAVMDPVAVGGINGDGFGPVAHLNLASYAHVNALAALPAQADAQNPLRNRQRTAIQNRHFQAVQFDDGIV